MILTFPQQSCDYCIQRQRYGQFFLPKPGLPSRMHGTSFLQMSLKSYVVFQQLDKNYIFHRILTSPFYLFCLTIKQIQQLNIYVLPTPSRAFDMSILQILVEDRQTTHREYSNTKRNIVRLKSNDIVVARTEVQSDKAKGKVAKLSYHVSGSFRILRYTGQSSYTIQQYG